MRRVAILIAGSRNASFYSQIAALGVALRVLPWQRWSPSIHAFLGDDDHAGDDDWRRWARYLSDVHVTWVASTQGGAGPNWAQVDATLERAPADADVLMSMDADTLPVAGFEAVLDRVSDEDLIAGVMAHYPPPSDVSPLAEWTRAAAGVIEQPLAFDHTYSLVEGNEPDDRRRAPFYVNGGVMFYSRSCFDRFAPCYLKLRSKLAERAVEEAFTGQVASTLAVTELGLKTWALPMRYNFPNDSVAARLYPEDAAHVVIHHYLRTGHFDRHRIFATREDFERFLALPLDGAQRTFQQDVARVFRSHYPFP